MLLNDANELLYYIFGKEDWWESFLLTDDELGLEIEKFLGGFGAIIPSSD